MTDLSIHQKNSNYYAVREKNPDSIKLEWYHHMKRWNRFCYEETIRRKQQRKEEKGERTSSKTVTSTEEPAEGQKLV